MHPRRPPSPDQLTMFDRSPFASRIEVPRDVQTPPVVLDGTQPGIDLALVDPNPGISVNLVDRASHIKESMTQLAEASRLGGLITAGETHRAKLERQYDYVDKVLGNAEAKLPRTLDSARTEFSRAIGRGAMIAAGWPKEVVNREAHDEYQTFLSKFAGSQGAKNRKKYGQKLEDQMAVLAGQKPRRRKKS